MSPLPREDGDTVLCRNFNKEVTIQKTTIHNDQYAHARYQHLSLGRAGLRPYCNLGPCSLCRYRSVASQVSSSNKLGSARKAQQFCRSEMRIGLDEE
jgi:hypothetical protein